MKPRILIFSLAYFPHVGGAEVAVKELTDRLSHEFDFEIISADIKSFWSKYFYPFWAVRRARQMHRERPFVLVWSIMANQAGIAGARFKKIFPKVPLLLTLQEGDDLDSLAYRLRLLFPRLFRVFQRADHIQAISSYLANWARRMGAVCPVTIIPNGVDLDKFSCLTAKLSGSTVITISRLVPKNGVDLLIRSLTFLPETVHLLIAGTGPEEATLRSLMGSLKLGARVSFLGHVGHDRLGQCLAQAWVFVRPSRSEGLGNVFLEAMAAGLPVVGTPVGGIPDFLRHGETGWLAQVESPESIAEQIEYILDPNNKLKVEAVVARGQQLAREQYNWDELAKRFGKLLESML